MELYMRNPLIYSNDGVYTVVFFIKVMLSAIGGGFFLALLISLVHLAGALAGVA